MCKTPRFSEIRHESDLDVASQTRLALHFLFIHRDIAITAMVNYNLLSMCCGNIVQHVCNLYPTPIIINKALQVIASIWSIEYYESGPPKRRKIFFFFSTPHCVTDTLDFYHFEIYHLRHSTRYTFLQ